MVENNEEYKDSYTIGTGTKFPGMIKVYGEFGTKEFAEKIEKAKLTYLAMKKEMEY